MRPAKGNTMTTTFAHRFAAAALIVSAGALGFAGTANAQPNTGGGTSGEWDIGVYDSCMQHHPPFHSDDDKLDWAINCCYSSGGVWGSGGGCVAPPAETSSRPDPLAPVAHPPNKIQAPPPPVNPTTPVNPGTFG
jgi:hypothetical protein